MSEQLIQLQRLEAELHEVNQELAQAARPLEWPAELNPEQRHEVADELRVRLGRWESVTQRILHALSTGSAIGQATPKCNEGGSR
jgi:hypothetical protein